MTAGQGAKLLLNELDPQRRVLLQAVSTQTVIDHDAEIIADLIDEGAAASVVVMNPPFASSTTRSDPTIAARHVLSAVKALHTVAKPTCRKKTQPVLCTRGLQTRFKRS